MAYPYITAEQARTRLGVEMFDRLLDEDGDGAADPSVVTDVIADASSKVAGYLRGNYDLEEVAASTPREVVRLTLDVFVAMAVQRHPETSRIDWDRVMKGAEADLLKLAQGKTRLDVTGTPEPASNTGGEYYTDPSAGRDRTFVDGFGDF